MAFAVGSLVRARDREWVVLPSGDPDLLMVRPLGGTEDEVTGIYLPLEQPPVRPAEFALPTAEHLGDHASARQLREAVRLGFRSSTGPFRSFAQIAVEPRGYQLVPLLMALKQDPVRLLIADDVGIGKTIEACLVAQELLARGEIRRLAVLCPPHLAEQWQTELRDKFHIDAQLVLASTASRLERGCALNQSLFEVYPHVIVSIDFVKSPRRRDEFLRTCPELVIVDEVHACALGESHGRSASRQQRHDLLRRLAEDEGRHLILVSATPHSGDETAFRSLLGLLNAEFRDLPADLSGEKNAKQRRHLAQYFVQRRRPDIEHYLGDDTPFPARDISEDTYTIGKDYRKLFRRVLEYAREKIEEPAAGEERAKKHRVRVRWWAVLGLLRALASSPAAAAATLRSRAPAADTETAEEADEVGRRTVLDLEDADHAERLDATPGCDPGEDDTEEKKLRRRLLDLAREAEELQGDGDEKLLKAVRIVGALVKEGYQPIVFCRFIDTAEYVAEELRKRLPKLVKQVQVAAVTGRLPPEEREARVHELATAERRVLVCTDCLSEGINLQQAFNAVVHYDLAWNPTRHEQREGRVDRYGQPCPTVRVLTYYGKDNQIDGIILKVLLNRHRKIRNDLGLSIPVPDNADRIIEAVAQNLLQSGKFDDPAPNLPFEELEPPEEAELDREWRDAAEREKRSRTMFAQEAIKVEEVRPEWDAARTSIGTSHDVAWFTRTALQRLGGSIQDKGDGVQIDLSGTPQGLQELLLGKDQAEAFRARFELPVPEGVVHLGRTHPFVERLASHVLGTALDPHGKPIACRAGVIATRAVTTRTTLVLLRQRFHLLTRQQGRETQLLAEESGLVGFRRAPHQAEWLTFDEARALLEAVPEGNVGPDRARDFLNKVLDGYREHLLPYLQRLANERGDELLDAHRRVRRAAGWRGISYQVEPTAAPDILGIYVYLPAD